MVGVGSESASVVIVILGDKGVVSRAGFPLSAISAEDWRNESSGSAAKTENDRNKTRNTVALRVKM